MRGRKPIPTAVKIANGNPGKRPLPENEPTPETGRPEAPEWLDPEARQEWDKITGELEAMGTLYKVDRAALVLYAVAMGRYERCTKLVSEHGEMTEAKNGTPIQNPYLAIANKAHEQASKLLVEFGLTPSSRTRVQATKKEEKADPMDFGLDD